jgi:hypothetical protein
MLVVPIRWRSSSSAARKRRTAPRTGEGRARSEAATPTRSKATFDLPAALVREFRVVGVELPSRVIGGSVSGLVEQALRKRLKELRTKYNDGRPFGARGAVKTRKGRPPRL